LKGRETSLILREATDPRDRLVALSFDDGPSVWTETILDALRDHGARATFFVVGRSIAGREGTLRRAFREGHEIGNHTTTHPNLSRKRAWSVRRELSATNSLISRTLGVAPRLFRPPYMAYTDTTLRVAGAQGLRWTVLDSERVSPKDFRMEDPEAIAEEVVASIRPGAVVDLHDGRPPGEQSTATLPSRQPTADAVPLILERLGASGYRFVTVSELFELSS